jgi:uncharacterized protein
MDGAARVFAGEYNASTLQVRIEGSEDPWIVTPGGAWCRGVYLAGALTEVDGSGDMIRCRIADPTGAFELVTGGRKTTLSEAIRNLPVPSFVTVIGQARMYRKGEQVVLLSVRPDDVRVVDRRVRDQWVLSTAESTLRRLDAMRLALIASPADERVAGACRHYAMTPAKLEELALMVGDAVQSIKPAAPLPTETGQSDQPDLRDVVLGIVKGTAGPRGIAIEEVIVQAAVLGMAKEAVLSNLESLIVEDECYQPQKGFVKAL